MKLTAKDLKEFLDEKHDQYNQKHFIESDPIAIPHLFSLKEDIEISGFLTATIAWGQRPTIIKNAKRMMQAMDEAPYEFILNASNNDLKAFEGFVHRTFNSTDCIYFIKALQHIYTQHRGLEHVLGNTDHQDLKTAIEQFRKLFFSFPNAPSRSFKHISNPGENSAAKRINMYLRWMVRKDARGVDFGIWKKISPATLYCPLDVHSGSVARKLGLLERKQNDWQAVTELTEQLRKMDPKDPVKYDFSLFGLGIFEDF